MKNIQAPVPDEYLKTIEVLCQEFNLKQADLVRIAVREFAERRGYPLPEVKLKHGGYRLENAISAHGWIDEYHVAKFVYGLDDYLIINMHPFIANDLDEYPLLQKAVRHNNAEFERQFPRDEDMDDSNPAYFLHHDETGRNKIREVELEYR